MVIRGESDSRARSPEAAIASIIKIPVIASFVWVTHAAAR